MLFIAHQQGHKVNATVTTTVTMRRMRWLRTGILATCLPLVVGCAPVAPPIGPLQVTPELVGAVAACLLVVVTAGEYLAAGAERVQRRRHHLRGEGVHEHKWHPRPFLTDGDVDVYACQVPGCRAHKREPHHETRGAR